MNNYVINNNNNIMNDNTNNTNIPLINQNDRFCPYLITIMNKREPFAQQELITPYGNLETRLGTQLGSGKNSNDE